MDTNADHVFSSLMPDVVLNALEHVGLCYDGALNSYENRDTLEWRRISATSLNRVAHPM